MKNKTIKFNKELILSNLRKEVKPITEEVEKELILDIKVNSPIKTGEYAKSSVSLGVSESSNSLKITIVNTDKKSPNVEEGWRKTKVNWHLANGVIKYSKGANTYEEALKRATENLKAKIKILG